MQEPLKIIEWNLNCRSDKEAIIADFIKDIIENEDIIIFTEIVKSDSVLQLMKELNEYNFYESLFMVICNYNKWPSKIQVQ